ncbi:unnamed protein product [Caenorhabditis brenneri]
MGGSPRRQRSTSATKRRAERRRQCSSADGIEQEEVTTIHGLSSIFIWILATSSLVVVITPPTTDPSRSTSHHQITPLEKLILESTSPADKMNAQFNNGMDGQMPEPPKDMFMPFRRQQGLRWRDDERMMRHFNQEQYSYPVRPILTEQPPHHGFGMGGASTSNHHATTSDYSEPGLMDMDLIDILWRSDIAVEKGTEQVGPAEQYLNDLQMLTDKSTTMELSKEEANHYTDCSSHFYGEFYRPQFYPKQYKMSTPELQTPPSEVEEHLPTDEDLDELLKDVSSEGSELNKVFDYKSPVQNDVSLSDAISYTQANLTEMQELQDSCNQVNITASSVVSSSQSATLFNVTDEPTREQWQHAETCPSEVFPSMPFYGTMQNDTIQQVVSNGQPSYDHSYSVPTPLTLNIGSSNNGRQQQTQTSPGGITATATVSQSHTFDPYHLQRNSFSDSATDSSSSRMSSESPRYNSESSSSPHDSRFYGKLVPSRETRYDRSRSPHTKISRVVPLANGQRKRGRQSKDEQLACENSLPVSAHQISEMSLSELQQVLKNDELSEYQRQLIRKIRRRGKNKVAARTCRQRRTDRHDKVMSLYH